MSSFINNTVTYAGKRCIAKALSGETIRFTKIVMGDGDFPEAQDIRTIEEVVSPRVTLDIVKHDVIEPDTAVLGGVFLNNEQHDGFWWRELGLYAEDPDLGEILYAYGNAGSFCSYIPPTGGQSAAEGEIDIITAIGPEANIDVYIAADAYATVSMYRELRERVEAVESSILVGLGVSQEALETAKKALGLANTNKAKIDELSGKTQTLWDAVFTAITTNPFLVTFSDLEGVTLTSGNWNKELARVEC